MSSLVLCCLLLLVVAELAAGQVRVDAHLEKAGYFVGEPIVVIVDVRNAGDEPVGYSACDGDVRLEVTGGARRAVPNILGCFSGMGVGGSCGVDHPPLLAPGETTSFRYLLKGYDLSPGRYEVLVAGKAGVRWKYYPNVAPTASPQPVPRHEENDPVAGAQFERSLPVNVVASTRRELQAVFAPLVMDADAADPVRRDQARSAISESAPRFLESDIARFAAEDRFDSSPIEALGRIASPGSRAQLRSLYGRSGESRRSAIVLALATAGDRGDAGFLAAVLSDPERDSTSRRYAALGLGRIGGGKAVRHLERALATASVDVQPSIATALGNTRSRAD